MWPEKAIPNTCGPSAGIELNLVFVSQKPECCIEPLKPTAIPPTAPPGMVAADVHPDSMFAATLPPADIGSITEPMQRSGPVVRSVQHRG